MSLTAKVTTEVKNSSGEVIASETTTLTGTSEIEIGTVAPGSSSVVVAIAVAAASIKAFAFKASQAVTLEVNNPADHTFALVAGDVFEWHDGSLLDNPITEDITSLKFIRGSAGNADITGLILVA